MKLIHVIWANRSMVKRGDIVREFGLELIRLKESLFKLIYLKMDNKILYDSKRIYGEGYFV